MPDWGWESVTWWLSMWMSHRWFLWSISWNKYTHRIRSLQIVSKSFAYAVIIFLISVAILVVVMDVLKCCFGIDVIRQDLQRIRRKKTSTSFGGTLQIYQSIELSSVRYGQSDVNSTRNKLTSILMTNHLISIVSSVYPFVNITNSSPILLFPSVAVDYTGWHIVIPYPIN